MMLCYQKWWISRLVLSSCCECDVNLAEPETIKMELKIWGVMPDANGAFLDLAFLNLHQYTSQV